MINEIKKTNKQTANWLIGTSGNVMLTEPIYGNKTVALSFKWNQNHRLSFSLYLCPKSRKVWKKSERRGKIGNKKQKSGRLFTLPLLTDRAGYATIHHLQSLNFVTCPLIDFILSNMIRNILNIKFILNAVNIIIKNNIIIIVKSPGELYDWWSFTTNRSRWKILEIMSGQWTGAESI